MRKAWLWMVVGVALGIGAAVSAGARAGGAAGWLEGVVRNAKGRPVAGAVVVITATTSREPVEEIAPVSDGQGRFRFRPLPPGRYTVRATARGWAPATRQAQVRAGRTATVTFTLSAAGV